MLWSFRSLVGGFMLVAFLPIPGHTHPTCGVIHHPQFMDEETEVQRKPSEDPCPLSGSSVCRNTFCLRSAMGQPWVPRMTTGYPVQTLPLWPPHSEGTPAHSRNLSNYSVVGFRSYLAPLFSQGEDFLTKLSCSSRLPIFLAASILSSYVPHTPFL